MTTLSPLKWQLWQKRLPSALESGRVQLQAHDFFEPQPVKNADVFLLKQILHDWADPEAIKILQQLRAAAQPHTKLILIDNVTQHACAFDPEREEIARIPGAVPNEAPAPLLANYGPTRVGYAGDVTVRSFVLLRFCYHEGGERRWTYSLFCSR